MTGFEEIEELENHEITRANIKIALLDCIIKEKDREIAELKTVIAQMRKVAWDNREMDED